MLVKKTIRNNKRNSSKKKPPCNKYNSGFPKFIIYEEYKRKNPFDKRKKNTFCRKNKDLYYIQLRSCPYKKMTIQQLKDKLKNLNLDINGNRAELCHKLFIYDLNNYYKNYNNDICNNKDDGINNFKFKYPLTNRYYCFTKEKMMKYILNKKSEFYIPNWVKEYMH